MGGCDDIEARVKFGGGKVFCSGDEGYLGVLLVVRQRVGNGVGLLIGEWDGSIVYKILYFVFETYAIVGVMTRHLVVGTVGIWIVVGREFFR